MQRKHHRFRGKAALKTAAGGVPFVGQDELSQVPGSLAVLRPITAAQSRPGRLFWAFNAEHCATPPHHGIAGRQCPLRYLAGPLPAAAALSVVSY